MPRSNRDPGLTAVGVYVLVIGVTFVAGLLDAFIARAGAESRIMVAALAGGEPVVVKTTTERVDAPALSADGKQILKQLLAEWKTINQSLNRIL